jgi:hypothetical protein
MPGISCVLLVPGCAPAAERLSYQLRQLRKSLMARSQLRVYYGPESTSAKVTKAQEAENTVKLPLGEIFPLLADAVQSQRTWLRDFKDDEITISTDLYEVILAYQHCRRPSA